VPEARLDESENAKLSRGGGETELYTHTNPMPLTSLIILISIQLLVEVVINLKNTGARLK
jgi:hypothetical protein